MKRKALIAAFGVICFGLGGIVVQAAAGTPEIDAANATIQLSGNLKEHDCVGEDTTDYVTYTGTWKGGETQAASDSTDYSLSGSLTISGIKWTVNRKSGRGVLTGKISLVSSTMFTTAYTGTLTLVTQGVLANGTTVPGRGWINAAVQLPDEGATPGDDSVIANTEFTISTGGANAQFGDAPGSLGVPDFSAVTNVAPKAADGVC